MPQKQEYNKHEEHIYLNFGYEDGVLLWKSALSLYIYPLLLPVKQRAVDVQSVFLSDISDGNIRGYVHYAYGVH